ncbi:glutaredoxin-related protein 5, mitochondrial isoform X2 [Heterocephalus glaber]|uniref:Glutaredoxin-related protein 5, mitochondrial isoform X2 n=1 Tax=Heterocephalus glaber TaxID=10181 RepID=A0AAX6RUB1_HETGA|nr:glutaredoxin-related protein 5, mitochondrial isoform X2 [Heterocephalus glaber]
MSGTLRRAAAALLRWGPGAGGVGLRGAGVRAAGAGTGAGGGGQAEQLDALVKKDKVVVFLKGTPEQPQCGFSNAVVQILRLHGVRDYAAYNVLDDPELRQGQAARGAGGGRGAEASKTTPTGPPSRRCTSTASSWGAVTSFCRCTRMGTWWRN